MRNLLQTQTLRHLLGIAAVAFLVFVGVMAALLNTRALSDQFVLSALLWLGEFELFHLVMHILIFVLVTLAVGLWRERNLWLIVAALLGGTLLIEGSQVLSRGYTIDIFVLAAAFYDLVVNSIGALIGWLILGWYQCAYDKGLPAQAVSGD